MDRKTEAKSQDIVSISEDERPGLTCVENEGNECGEP